MQISLRRQAPPKKSPLKRAFEKYKPRGLFSEFYGILLFGKVNKPQERHQGLQCSPY